ncbi:MAG: hypothetical protein JW743_04855 [Deltaproteobacteria bacterium]|nr:hypothetical protein [Deltaproteobacteria bacterium]
MIKNWAVRLGIIFFIPFVIFGCASLPRPEEMKAAIATYQLPKLPEDGKAIVYVVFQESWYKGIRFDVFIDNQEPKSEIGYNMGGQYIYFNLTPGEHKILSKAENWAEINVSAKAGDIIFIRQEPYTGLLNARNKLLNLQDYEGKYYVKTLIPGTIINHNQQNVPIVPTQARLEQNAQADTFIGTITGGNFAKGVGFSNINVRLEVTSDNGGKEYFYVRSDSILADAGGKKIDYLYAIQSKGKKVEIEHFIITDATGGDPSRSDFAFEIGKKGVRLMRFLDWKSTN